MNILALNLAGRATDFRSFGFVEVLGVDSLAEVRRARVPAAHGQCIRRERGSQN
jgi:hypothetical protein